MLKMSKSPEVEYTIGASGSAAQFAFDHHDQVSLVHFVLSPCLVARAAIPHCITHKT